MNANDLSENYNPKTLEPKLQAKWEQEQPYLVSNETAKSCKYLLSMFPYPSGKLHMGHVRNYTITDVLSRYHRLKGAHVLQPMGWDAFGMPAENAAMAHQVAPAKWTAQNIASMREQLKALGLSIDWSREFATCSPDYYRWEQWFFLELYKKGLVYKKLATVNWDPVDQTVLANEQVVDGRGWRSGALVEKRDIPMYYFKITAYADELLADLDQLEGHWPAEVIAMQRNWIGRSEGMQVQFTYQTDDISGSLDVFTTRPDTLMGVTYLAVAAEHPLARYAAERNAKIAEFCAACKQGSVAEADLAKAEKVGIDTGLTAIHPLTQKPIPIWVANYVLMSYGSGAVMAVPAHDTRDFEFATSYQLPILPVIAPAESAEQAYTEKGTLINSGRFDGMDFDQAFQAILDELEPAGLAKRTVQYRLRDWGISRQRYWGCPIPMVNCPHCGNVPVEAGSLPVRLPTDVVPDGRGNPLKHIPEFLQTTCPKCDGPAERETDTFDTFMESSWYYARFTSTHCDHQMIDPKAAKTWLPVDQYVGGVEHAVMHLLYARFFHKLMRDNGLVDSDEPFKRLLTQGMVLARTYHRSNDDGSKTYYFADEVNTNFDDKGQPTQATLIADGQPVEIGKIEKMSKSKNNGVDPQATIDTYGADTVRLYTLFAAPADQTLEWSDDALKGPFNFLKKVWRIAYDHKNDLSQSSQQAQTLDDPSLLTQAKAEPSLALRRKTHETIQKIDADLSERLALNTPVSSLMELANMLAQYNPSCEAQATVGMSVRQEALVTLLALLSLYAPHISEHLLVSLGYDIHQMHYPTLDSNALSQTSVTWVIQVNGKVRARLNAPVDISRDDIQAKSQSLPELQKYLTSPILKVVVVPNKLVNFVVAS